MNPELPFLTTPDMDSAIAQFDPFLNTTPASTRVVALTDCDADGVAAGVVWRLGMQRLGYSNLGLVLPDRERNAWSDENRRRVRELEPGRLFVLDLGSQPEPVLPGIPTCFIDHHRPTGVPPGDTLISAYSWNPIPCTSLLAYDLFRGFARHYPSPGRIRSRIDVGGLDWIAAIGAISDLGDGAPFDLLPAAKKRYTAKYLKEATALINAARRCADYIPEVAVEALLTFHSPRELVEADSPITARLQAARVQVSAALQEAKKAGPVFAGNVALVRIHSACQVHPLIATIWRTRLPKAIVIVANDGFMPGRVNFSVRTASGLSVLEFLDSIVLPEGEGHFGYGHDQASNGSLPPDRWQVLLKGMGFTEAILNRSPGRPPHN
jgi:single-stranded-DNA-specific exonuclease